MTPRGTQTNLDVTDTKHVGTILVVVLCVCVHTCIVRLIYLALLYVYETVFCVYVYAYTHVHATYVYMCTCVHLHFILCIFVHKSRGHHLQVHERPDRSEYDALIGSRVICVS